MSCYPFFGRFWDSEQERCEEMLPKASYIVGKQGHMFVRISPTPEEAAAFLGQESASPLRMHLMSGS